MTNDEKFAGGAAIGGSASVLGHGATVVVAKAIGIKCVGFGAAKVGAALALTNPAVGAVCVLGGLSYLAIKKCMKK